MECPSSPPKRFFCLSSREIRDTEWLQGQEFGEHVFKHEIGVEAVKDLYLPPIRSETVMSSVIDSRA